MRSSTRTGDEERMSQPARAPDPPPARSLILCLAACSLAVAPSLSAQETVHLLHLAEAEALALRRGAELRVAEERGRAAAEEERAAGAFRYPSLELDAGWLRSDDPVAAFGTKLRQQRFGDSDFALPELNDPAPVSDWTAGAMLVWRGLDPSAWASRDAARLGAEAARWTATRARAATLLRTRVLYYGVVRAEARLRAADAAETAARATAERFRRRMEDGLLTRAEVLQAEAELASAVAEHLGAERLRDEARLVLGLHLGWSADSVPAAADTLQPPDSLPPLPGEEEGAAERSDLRALAARARAAAAEGRSARFGWLPVLEAHAGYRKYADAPFASDGTAWTVALGLRWSPFDGFRRAARAGAADARRVAAGVEYEHASRLARVEVRVARQAVASAIAAVAASDAAMRAAAEGRDLMRRRFEEGLAGATDLLSAEARAAEMEARAIDARAEHHVARARLQFALEAPEPERREGRREGG